MVYSQLIAKNRFFVNIFATLHIIYCLNLFRSTCIGLLRPAPWRLKYSALRNLKGSSYEIRVFGDEMNDNDGYIYLNKK